MATNKIKATDGSKQTSLGAGVALGNTGNKTPTTTQAEVYGTDIPLGTKNQFDRKSPAYIDRTVSNPSGYTQTGVASYGDGKIARSNTWKWDISTLKHDIAFANGSKPIIQNSSQNKVRVSEVFDKNGATVSYTWTVPSNIDLSDSVYIQCVGAGGNGVAADAGAPHQSKGGGGGAYAAKEIKTTARIGASYTLTIGEANTTNTSVVDSASATVVLARSGADYTVGAASSSTGDTKYNGGAGGTLAGALSPTGAGGGGGASGSEVGAGAAGSNGNASLTNVAGGIATGIGGSGGYGADNANSGTSVINGSTPGGGGGGGGLDDDSALAPGVGGPGRIVISYTIFV